MHGLQLPQPGQTRVGQARLAEVRHQPLDDLAGLEREGQPLAPAEQIAMLPNRPAVRSIAGRVAQAAADRAMLFLDDGDGHGQAPVGVERVRVADLDRGKQSGVDQRAPARIDLAAIEGLAGLPWQARLQKIAIDRLQPLDGHVAEAGIGAGVDLQLTVMLRAA